MVAFLGFKNDRKCSLNLPMKSQYATEECNEQRLDMCNFTFLRPSYNVP